MIKRIQYSVHPKSITILIFVAYIFSTINLFSQSYPMVVYDIESQVLDTIPSFEIDSIKTLDNTFWNYGYNDEQEILDIQPPDSTYNNSGFTDYYPAQQFFDINKYPIRTVVNIFRIDADTLKQTCSGILVQKKYVLTDCHCIGKWDSLKNFNFLDSLYIYPAYDNGRENPIWSSTKAIEYFTFAINMKLNYSTIKDIALIKLKDDIGLETGWMGIAFNDDDTFFENNVLHKLSYPGEIDPSDTTRVFNGDTLYYNYGKLDLIDNEWLGYGINGIRGQSGSSLFYTNNDEYYSFGTQVWAANSRHIRINREIFYSFKSIMDSTTTSIEKESIALDNYYLANAYPNPFNPSTTIKYSIPIVKSKHASPLQYVTLKVYDILGREVTRLVNKEQQPGNYEVVFNATKLPSGTYFYKLTVGKYSETKKMLLLK